jgi:hypothetical protein
LTFPGVMCSQTRACRSLSNVMTHRISALQIQHIGINKTRQ